MRPPRLRTPVAAAEATEVPKAMAGVTADTVMRTPGMRVTLRMVWAPAKVAAARKRGAKTVEGFGGVPVGPDGCPLVPDLKLTKFATLSQTATLMVQAPSDSRYFFAERLGRILIFENGKLKNTPFLNIKTSVAPLETERGLLSLALHPSFAENGRFYVVYTRAVNDPLTPAMDTLGDLVLAEGSVSNGNPNVAQSSLDVLLTVPKAVRYHNGGMIAFGQDGYLYMTTGDDGRGYTSQRTTLQELDNRIGKILRIDVDDPDSRPDGNMPTGDEHVWDYGVRNPWRMSFDLLTGDMYFSDVGDRSFEELNYEPAGEGQRNYGWALTEGAHCSEYYPGCDVGDVTAPLVEIAHDGVGSVDGKCTADFETAPAECNRAVIGGYVYRGPKLPELDGRYFYGDYIQNRIYSLIVEDGAATCHAEHTDDLITAQTPIQGLISFSQDAKGEVYLLDIFANVYRIARQ
jgi:glucose/arabinose dehydrogenase